MSAEAHAALTNFLLVEKLDRVKKSKLYKSWDFSTWEEFIEQTFPFSVDTADRMVKDLRELGRGWFDLNDVLRVTRQAFRLVNPEFTDKGEIVLAGQAYALTKANSDAIQMAFSQAESELRRKAEEATSLKSELNKTREERDNAKKAAVDLTKKLREVKNPAPFADADEDHQIMLRVQSEVDAAMMRLRKLVGREMSADNETRYVGLCEKLYRDFMRSVDDSKVTFYSKLDPPDPSIALFLDNEPDHGINLIAEHLKEKK